MSLAVFVHSIRQLSFAQILHRSQNSFFLHDGLASPLDCLGHFRLKKSNETEAFNYGTSAGHTMAEEAWMMKPATISGHLICLKPDFFSRCEKNRKRSNDKCLLNIIPLYDTPPRRLATISRRYLNVLVSDSEAKTCSWTRVFSLASKIKILTEGFNFIDQKGTEFNKINTKFSNHRGAWRGWSDTL